MSIVSTVSTVSTMINLNDRSFSGTGQGMGFQLVNLLARDGNTIHCVDISEQLNAGVHETYGSRTDVTIYTYLCDISDASAVERLAEEVRGNCGNGHVQYVLNNAAIVCGKLFSETPVAQYTKVMNVNALGLMHVCKAFFNEMLEKGGHIMNTASIAGIGPAPRMVDYAASKHAVVGFSRGLQWELDHMRNDRLKVTVIFPHFTNTGMFNGCTVKLAKAFPVLSPEYVAQRVGC